MQLDDELSGYRGRGYDRPELGRELGRDEPGLDRDEPGLDRDDDGPELGR